jgi:hypothetical protein
VPASISAEIASTAPGATCTILGAGFGASGSVVVAGQGADGTSSVTIAAPTFTNTSISFRCPDGLLSGIATVTAQDATTATVAIRVNSQYVFAAEYVGEGDDTSGFATGELDAILQRASAICDGYLAQGSELTSSLRVMQVMEQHRYRDRTRRVYPRRYPIVSIDAVQYIASPSLKVAFSPDDFVVAPDANYIEQVVWSIGLTMVQSVAGFTMYNAGLVNLTYTSGYGWAQYPQVLREATILVATELITQRGIQAAGLGGLARVKTGGIQYDRRGETFTIPVPAMTLLDSLKWSRPA